MLLAITPMEVKALDGRKIVADVNARFAKCSNYGMGADSVLLPQVVAKISAESFKNTPFSCMGLPFSIFSALRKEGYEGHDILTAVRNALYMEYALDDVSDIRAFAQITKFSDDPRGAVEASVIYRDLLELNADELVNIGNEVENAQTPAAKAAAQRKWDDFKKRLAKESGLDKYQ
jgi:hypothetical protein